MSHTIQQAVCPDELLEVLDCTIPEEMLTRLYDLECDVALAALPDIHLDVEANSFSDFDSHRC